LDECDLPLARELVVRRLRALYLAAEHVAERDDAVGELVHRHAEESARAERRQVDLALEDLDVPA
jgi:hypothetical protein